MSHKVPFGCIILITPKYNTIRYFLQECVGFTWKNLRQKSINVVWRLLNRWFGQQKFNPEI